MLRPEGREKTVGHWDSGTESGNTRVFNDLTLSQPVPNAWDSMNKY